MDHLLQLNEFFVEGGDQFKSHVLLHITEPSTDEERAKGYFFAIAEINHGETKYITALQEIIDAIENGYYETPDEVNKSALEIVLEKMNHEYRTLAGKDIVLNCMVGVIRQPDILFSYCGTPQIWLFYKNREDSYRALNLITSSPHQDTVEPTAQLFSDLVQGKISPDDYVFAATKHVGEYFDADRLQKIITARPPRQSAEHLERVLKEIKDGFSFGGIIFHITKTNSDAETPRKLRPTTKGGSAKSLSGLFTTEQKTAYTLSPTILQRLGEKTKSLLQTARDTTPEDPVPNTPTKTFPIPEINATHRYPHQPNRATTPKPRVTKRVLSEKIIPLLSQGLRLVGKALAGLALVVWSLVHGLIRNIVFLFIVAFNYQNRRRYIVDDWKRAWRRHQENFKRLPIITKIILIGSIIVALLFIVSLLYLRHKEQERIADNLFQTTAQTIKDKTDSAESALIYNNQTDALNTITAARQALASLACIKKDQKTTCQDLGDHLDALLMRARKITSVTPLPLITWPSGALNGIIKINSKIIGWSTTSSELSLYDTLTHENKTIPTYPGSTGFIGGAVPKENDYLLLLGAKKDTIRLDPKDNSVNIADLSFPTDHVTIAGTVIYNRRLYSLDTLNNQIYKHDSIKTGFNRGKEWVKDQTVDLKDGASLAIDGDLFVLKNNGQIIKLTSGVSQPFVVQGLDPGLGSGGKIWTYNDVNFIYILDPLNHRLVIVDKDGHLIKQITATEFKNLTGMIIDEPSNTAYINDGSTLYQISLK